MHVTPLETYFSPKTCKNLKEIFAIKCMEQLISLDERPDVLNGVAKQIGEENQLFKITIQTAKRKLGVIKHSGRKYQLGALRTNDKILRK